MGSIRATGQPAQGRLRRLSLHNFPERIGAGDRDRTGDIQLGKLAFYR
jgi:hypothetical protein